jgi:hypothetical protein
MKLTPTEVEERNERLKGIPLETLRKGRTQKPVRDVEIRNTPNSFVPKGN